MDEQALVRSAQAGDAEVFGLLIDRYADRLYNLLVRVSGTQDAEDLLQETFMKAYASIGNFSGASAFYTWLFRIALNTAHSMGRKRSPLLFSDNEHGNPLEHEAASDPSPLEAAQRSEELASLEDALQRLPAEDREVILLREIEGMAYDEIAQSVGISTAAARSRLHRARQRLIGILEDKP